MSDAIDRFSSGRNAPLPAAADLSSDTRVLADANRRGSSQSDAVAAQMKDISTQLSNSQDSLKELQASLSSASAAAANARNAAASAAAEASAAKPNSPEQKQLQEKANNFSQVATVQDSVVQSLQQSMLDTIKQMNEQQAKLDKLRNADLPQAQQQDRSKIDEAQRQREVGAQNQAQLGAGESSADLRKEGSIIDQQQRIGQQRLELQRSMAGRPAAGDLDIPYEHEAVGSHDRSAATAARPSGGDDMDRPALAAPTAAAVQHPGRDPRRNNG